MIVLMVLAIKDGIIILPGFVSPIDASNVIIVVGNICRPVAFMTTNMVIAKFTFVDSPAMLSMVFILSAVLAPPVPRILLDMLSDR